MNWSEFLEYDSSTGRLLWKVKRPGPKTKVGSEAGSVKHDGRYRSFVLFRRRHYTHRVIWEIINGPIQSGLCIDHIDGNGLNNRIENLRLVTMSENQRNSRLPKNNSTGIHGVYARGRGYIVQCAGKHIGSFANFFDACCSRKAAERINGYHENHGRNSA